VLEALQVPTFYHPLVPLLDDPSIEVQVSTIRAAGRIRAPELIPHLVEKLAEPPTCWYATEALARCLGDDLGHLERLLDERGDRRPIRRQLVYLLRRQRSPRAVRRLLTELESDDEIRSTALESLLELRDQGLSVDGRSLRGALDRELKRAYELRMARYDLRDVDILIQEALTQRIQRAGERLLMILDLLYPQVSHAWLGDTLSDSDARARATAVELLENLLDRNIREPLVPLFGGGDDEILRIATERLRVPHRPQIDHVRDLARCGDEWLRSCALQVVGRQGLIPLRDVAVEALDAGDQWVRETAAVALLRLPRGLQGDGEDPLERLAPAR